MSDKNFTAAPPVIVVPARGTVRSRQEIAGELVASLLQNEKFLKRLQEKKP